MDLSGINLARYRRFSEHALRTRCSVGIALHKEAGFVLDGDFEGSIGFDNLKQRAIKSASTDFMLIRGPSNETYALRNFVFRGSRKYCLLALRICNLNERSDVLPALTEEIVCSIGEDYAAQQQMAGLYAELAGQYKELNLLCGLDGTGTYDCENTPARLIVELLRRCREFLPIDMAAVFAPGDGIQIHDADSSFGNANVDTILREVAHSKVFRPESTRENTPLNRNDLENSSGVRKGFLYKTITVPLVDHSHNIAGMFVLANRMLRPDFSARDHKLAEIIAAEISKALQSVRDRLTGLFNRAAFEHRLETMIENAHTDKLQHLIVYMDLDQFKLINDSAGHDAGDQLLKFVSAIIHRSAPGEWFIARLGGDEFGMLAENTSMEYGSTVAQRICKQIAETPFAWHDRIFQMSVSVGLAQISAATSRPADALSAADVACQLAKNSGRSQVRCYDPADDNLADYHEQIRQAGNISEALGEDRFVLYGQAITPLQTDREGDHFEILVRMRNRAGDLIPPGLFIPAAERFGLIASIDRWVVENGIRAMEQLDRNGKNAPVTCSINVSGASIGDQSFLDFIGSTILASSIEPSRLTFELTETAAISNLAAALHFMETIKQLGCSFALDDFGVGTSSFGYLRSLPVDYLKIDGSFVKSVVGSELNLAMVRSINELGHLMGLKTVAEFVENSATRDLLREAGIDYAQGFEIDEPSLLIDKHNDKKGK